MPPLDRWRVQPQEAAFVGLLVWLTVRLVIAGAWGKEVVLYCTLLAAIAGAVWWCPPAAPRWRWLVRLWLAPVVINSVYFSLGRTVPALHPVLEDARLQAWDQRLFGASLSLRLEPLISPLLTEVLSGCYLLFFPMLAGAWITYSCRALSLTRLFFAGFFSLYALGYAGYTLVPARGPHLDPVMAAQFTVPLEGFWLTDVNRQVVLTGCNGVDVFPSLHVALSAFILLFDFRHSRRRFWIFLGPCLGLWLSTLYLRYHYAVDLLAGLALTISILVVLSRMEQPGPP